MKSWIAVLKHAFTDFGSDRCSTLAAALSYYTIFAIPPLLMLLVLVVGRFVDPAQLTRELHGQFAGIMGPKAASGVVTILTHAKRPDLGTPLAATIGLGGLLLGAIGFFLSLQSALNATWQVQPDPASSGVRTFLLQRLLSFGVMLAVGFLLLVSLVLSAAVAAFGGVLSRLLGGALSSLALQSINFGVSLAVSTLLFVLVFRVLPDARLPWATLWLGGFVTALLFVIGKLLIGLYLGLSNPGGAFGAAGSVILVLVWIYYSSLIVLFGAEFTQAWAVVRGPGIRPKPGAVRVARQVVANREADRADTVRASEEKQARDHGGEGRAAD